MKDYNQLVTRSKSLLEPTISFLEKTLKFGKTCRYLFAIILSSSFSAYATDNAVSQPTVKEAQAFIENAEKLLADKTEEVNRASWMAANFINYDTQFIQSLASKEYIELSVGLSKQAARFNDLNLNPETRRKLDLLKLNLTLPAPSDSAKSKELAEIAAKMRAMYGTGKYCRNKDGEERCLTLGDMYAKFATSHDEQELKDIWIGWREISPPMRKLYQRQVEIANEGAQELGYDNLSTMWRSKYDMHPDDFAKDVDHQWNQVKPLYEALHCHVRAKLNEFYGDEIVPQTGKIPAHLLGNMWAQQWSNIYRLVKPENTTPGVNMTGLILKSGMSETEMVEKAEQFFVSLGFEPLPQTFWERSLFVKPKDREVVCHASAWNLNNVDDLRIKMCIKKNEDDFITIHHELGHNFYQRAYNQQPYLFQGSANDGFHEATGDVVALSVTPKYMVDIGLLDKEPEGDGDLTYLMKMALDKIAFLPFGLLVDKWRWKVFNGEIPPGKYNEGWWQLRENYQGIKAPVDRPETGFDPGAKYHIPGNTPYMRYFLAFIQQFQFHRALCDEAGHKGPLHRCSIYNNKKAGAKLKTMLEMGMSQPWPEAMYAITGQKELDASAIIDYFSPLKSWLDKQNKNRQCGW